MSPETFVRRVALPVSRETVFRWHGRPGAFARLLPPWEDVEVIDGTPALVEGEELTLRASIGPLKKAWRARIAAVEPGLGFTDEQLSGPFRRWVHEHRMLDADTGPAGGSILEDRVEYALPMGRLGRWVGGGSVARRLRRMFDYRHSVTAHDLARHAQLGEERTMKILITGASGLVGSDLTAFLQAGGHDVVRLVRRAPKSAGEVRWDPERGVDDVSGLEGADAVVHLAGENIAAGRWTTAQKQRIRESRVVGTRVLVEALRKLERRPAAFVSASAIGYYGDRGDEVLGESAARGSGFLSDVCDEWEAASRPLTEDGVRVAHMRFGIILSPRGGALKKMLLPFKLGAGGKIGSGEQWMSWIAIDDVVGALHHTLASQELSGPINTVAPAPVRNKEFTKTLGAVLGRPTVLPVPAFGARLAFGEMADELLLASARVEPKELLRSGYDFAYPTLEGGLRHVLGKTRAEAAGERDRVIDTRLWERWQSPEVPVRVGISSCLLGRAVRYDGGHCRDRFLVDELGKWVQWAPVCPEQEVGMSTPRPVIRLVDEGEGVRLVETKSGSDWSDRMEALAERRVEELKGGAGLDGYVLKKGSPSCAMERMKVYMTHASRRDGVGAFTRVLKERWRELPLEEEGRLNDSLLRENFVERVFARNRWRVFLHAGPTRRKLVEFHTAHKLLLRAHDERTYGELGQLVGSAGTVPDTQLFERYEVLFHRALAKLPKVKSHVNVMQHAFGYLKRVLDSRDKLALQAALDDFRVGLMPLLVPLSLLRFHVYKHEIGYLSDQLYLDPHPKELMLRKRA